METGFFDLRILLDPTGHLVEIGGYPGDPALLVPGLDAREIDLGQHADAAGDLHGLGLGAAHAAQPRAQVDHSGQVLLGGDVQVHAPGIEQGQVGAVDDALGPDVHPAAGGHLAVVGNAHGRGLGEAGQVVVHADQHAVGGDHARRLGAATRRGRADGPSRPPASGARSSRSGRA